MATVTPLHVHEADPQDDLSLPGWLYHDPEFHRVEMEKVMRPAWQIVCHLSEIPRAGDWRTIAYLGESIIVVRGEAGEVRAFLNLCRHRGSRLLDGEAGCVRRFVCPYHAWTYGLDGSLVGVPERSDYQETNWAGLGLVPVEREIWRGFVFVRLEPGGHSVAEMMGPHDAEVEHHRFEDLQAMGRVTFRTRKVNWKNVADNYSDGLHIAVAHPGLTRLLGRSYRIEALAHTDRMSGELGEAQPTNLSERAYQRFLPKAEHLPEEAQRRWLYLKLWPNLAFDIYPDQVDFMQFLPVSATETLIREIAYALPDDRREMRAARYLNWRINRRVNAEDTALIARVQSGMQSRSYRAGPLGRSEVCLRSFAQKLRRLIPEARLDEPPPPGWSGLPVA